MRSAKNGGIVPIVLAVLLFAAGPLQAKVVNQKWVARYNGPAGPDYPRAIALDSSGSVYVTGESAGAGTDSDYATVKYVQNECLTKIDGDLNNDCRVNFEDFAIFMSHWLECNLSPSNACDQ